MNPFGSLPTRRGLPVADADGESEAVDPGSGMVLTGVLTVGGQTRALVGIGEQSESSAYVTMIGEDFIFSEGRWPVYSDGSMSGNSAVIMTGMFAAMAIPSFNKVRETSREKVVTNNLRQIASAGQQYILETGEPEVKYPQLVGDYFSEIQPVAGESYEDLVVKEAGGTLTVTMSSGQEVSYMY